MKNDEHRLVRAMARRDRAAWAAMYDRHVSDIFSVLYHLVGGDRATAEDLNQEVWLLAIQQIDNFDSRRGEFRDWILGIARHRAIRHHRRGLPRDHVAEDSLYDRSDALPPLDQLEGGERADVVRAALLCLSDDRRHVVRLKYVEGLSVSDIAAQTGRSAKGVESLLSRAREQLRTLLRPYFSNPTGGEHREPTDAAV
jgi:RNA polymerase sigma-70 factor (ECF subfamily)